MSGNEGKPVRLSQSWCTKDGVTIPAGTKIRVTEEQERELREGGYLEDLSASDHDYPVTAGPEEDDEDDDMFFSSAGPEEDDDMFLSYGPEEPDDEEFLNVHRDDTGS